jgi:hypothetical protein
MNVAVKAFEGQVRQMILAAEGDAATTMKSSDAYFAEKTLLAEATVYSRDKEAQGILAQKTAEASGIQKMSAALEGKGGPRMVQLEYARRLEGIRFDAQPFTYQSDTLRLNVLDKNNLVNATPSK